MVVAARAIHREAEENLAGRGHDVIEAVVAGQLAVSGLVVPNAEPIEAGGDDGVGVGRGEFIAGELLAEEAVVRFVGVEGADDVVAEAPRVRLVAVALVAVALGEAHEVEPVAAPLLAVARRVEQTVNQQLPRARRFVGEERLYLGGRWRQTGQIVVSAADQLARRRGGIRGEVLRGELRENEGVDGIRARRFAIVDLWRDRFLHRLKRPMRAVFVGDLKFLPDRRRRRFADGHRRAELHPLGQVGDLPRGEPLLRRHLEILALITHGDDEAAFRRIARHDDRAALAARANGAGGIESEMALLFFRAVAGVTLLREERANFALKELETGGTRFGGGETLPAAERSGQGESQCERTRRVPVTRRRRHHYFAPSTACTGMELPKFLKSLNDHTTFLSFVTSMNCGLFGPA